MLFTLGAFIVLISIVVLFHEFGHFIVGKYFKMGIDAFAIGFGRPIFKFKKGETEYRFNWIPFGGYVKFVGELDDEDIPEEDKHRAFSLRPGHQKAAVVFAGPFMNVVLAFLIFTIMFLAGFPTDTSLVGTIVEDSPAEAAGILTGDRIVEIDGHPIWRFDEIAKYVEGRPGVPTDVIIEREGKRITLSITPDAGIKYNMFGFFDSDGYIKVSGDTVPTISFLKSENRTNIATGDKLLKLNDIPIKTFNDIRKVVDEHPHEPLTGIIDHQGVQTEVFLNPKLKNRGPATFDLVIPKGTLGVSNNGLRPAIAVTSMDSAAYRAGLKTGMLITEIDGRKIRYRETLERILSDGESHQVVAVENWSEKAKDWNRQTFQLAAVNDKGMPAYGLEFTDQYIFSVEKDGPADKAGLLPKDKIIAVDGQAVETGNSLNKLIRASQGNPVTINFIREFEQRTTTVTPVLHKTKDMMSNLYQFYIIDIKKMVVYASPERLPEKHGNPLVAIKRGTELALKSTAMMIQGIGHIFKGNISVKSMGSVGTIFVLAGDHARAGAFPFFWLVAVISLNLAIVNLLPIPILDGGHLMFYTIEMVRRKPTSPVVRDYAMRVGLFLLLFLLVSFLYFDFSRFSIQIFDSINKWIPF